MITVYHPKVPTFLDASQYGKFCNPRLFGKRFFKAINAVCYINFIKSENLCHECILKQEHHSHCEKKIIVKEG